MNMNKYFSFAIVVFLMAVPLVLTSCGKDNILDDVEELQPELKVWTEPYHVESSTIDEVKNYMEFSMKRYGLVSEATIAGSIQLTYKTGNALADITYIGNMIRSRTYEAFFPLITVALIYLVIVLVLSYILRRFERRLKKSER